MKNGTSVRCYISQNSIPFDESVFGQLLGRDGLNSGDGTGGGRGGTCPHNALRYLRVRVTLTLTLTLRHRVSSVLGFLWLDKPLCPPTKCLVAMKRMRTKQQDV